MILEPAGNMGARWRGLPLPAPNFSASNQRLHFASSLKGSGTPEGKAPPHPPPPASRSWSGPTCVAVSGQPVGWTGCRHVAAAWRPRWAGLCCGLTSLLSQGSDAVVFGDEDVVHLSALWDTPVIKVGSRKILTLRGTEAGVSLSPEEPPDPPP